MGLDMYLNAKRYLWRVRDEEQEIAQKISDIGLDNGGMRVKEVCCEAMYWRKANAIHYWFVQNIQSGADDCREYLVTRDNLRSLLRVCESVLEDPSTVDELLPPAEGFFFGSNEIDDWYWDDVKATVGTIQRLLNDVSEDWDFYYASSW
jgi:hypothetical protein